MVVFLIGPIVDLINGQYKYSIATMVSFFTSLITAALGSRRFTDFSKFIVEQSQIASLTTKAIVVAIAVMIIVIVPTVLSFTNPDYAGTSASTIAIIYAFIGVLITLGGFDFLGKPTTQETLDRLEFDSSARKERLQAESERYTAAKQQVINDLRNEGAADTMLGGTRISLEPDVCDVPGFTWLKNSLAPPSIIISQTVLLCHLMEAIANRDTETVSNTVPLAATSLISFGLQWWIFMRRNCGNGFVYGNNSPLIAYVISIVAAATSYGALKYLTKEEFTTNKTDKGIFSNPVPQPKAKTQKDKDTTTIKVDSPGDTSLPVDDQDQFVCEAYRDGELITSTIVE